MHKYIKDPDAVLDYSWDWSEFLADGETISTHLVIVPDGITLDESTADDNSVTAWLSGGINGEHYTVTCRITTNQARTDDRSILIRVREQ
jgi:hypothetical protein